MQYFVIDTSALFWFLTKSPKLSPRAKELLFDKYEQGAIFIYVPFICLLELYYLVLKEKEKYQRELDFKKMFNTIKAKDRMQIFYFDEQTLENIQEIQDISEMHDRLVAEVSYRFRVPVITNDPEIKASKFVETVW